MTKILTIGDIHAKASNIKEVSELTKRIKQSIIAHEPTAVIILGDLHDTFEKIHTQALNIIDVFFEDVTSTGVDIYYIIGNHCAINNSIFLEPDHAFNVFKNKYKNLKIIDNVEEININGLKFLMCPYVPPGRFLEAIKDRYNNATAIFAHQEFYNAQFAGITSEIGDKWPLDYPLVISGHIHERGSPQTNIQYIGTPYHTTFAEEGDKYISLFEFNDDGAHKETLINLDMPKKMTVHLSVDEFMEYNIPSNSQVRIIVTGTTEQINKLQKSSKFKELSLVAKVIPKKTDNIIARKNTGNLNYISILKSSVESESPAVKTVFNEVSK